MSNLETVSKLVQPIVLLVDKADPAAHVDGVRAAALASVRAYARELGGEGEPAPAWDEWLSGPFTKTVRRADAKTFRKLVDSFTGEHAGVDVGKAKALAFRPVTYEDMDKALTRLQVSGTVLPERDSDHHGKTPGGAPIVYVNASLGMSTGKQAAQAAHALLAWYLTLARGEQVSWDAEGCPFGVRFVDADSFGTASVRAVEGTRIIDAGHTEIDPHTATTFVLHPGN